MAHWAVVCLHAALWVQWLLERAMDGRFIHIRDQLLLPGLYLHFCVISEM